MSCLDYALDDIQKSKYKITFKSLIEFLNSYQKEYTMLRNLSFKPYDELLGDEIVQEPA